MNGTLSPQYIIEKLYDLTDGKAIISTEVGQNQMWASSIHKFTRARSFISSGGLGTMGYGLGIHWSSSGQAGGESCQYQLGMEALR